MQYQGRKLACTHRWRLAVVTPGQTAKRTLGMAQAQALEEENPA
jgi:hypothetical protein